MPYPEHVTDNSVLSLMTQLNDSDLIEAHRVATKANQLTAERITQWGSVLSNAHQTALSDMTKGIVLQLYKIDDAHWQKYSECSDYQYFKQFTAGRWVYPMPPGTAKSQTIVSIIQALHELGITNRSLLVASFQVEANSILIRQMTDELGLPSNLLAIRHSKRFDQEKADAFAATGYKDLTVLGTAYASLPSAKANDLPNHQHIFITHNKIKASHQASDWNLYSSFNGDSRLVIWDEVMMPRSNTFVSHFDLGMAQPALKNSRKSEDRDAIKLLVDTILHRYEEAKTISLSTNTPQTITIPSELGGISFAQHFNTYTENAHKRGKQALEDIRPLENMLGQKVRVNFKRTADGSTYLDHLLHMVVQVPDYLNNIAILDASHFLTEYMFTKEQTIAVHPEFKSYADGSFKRFDNVRLHLKHDKNGSAKYGNNLRDEFKNGIPRSSSHLRNYIIETVKSFGPDDAVLFITFKDKPDHTSIKEKIISDLKASGVDTDERVMVRGQSQPRFNFLTWGYHTGISSFSYCNKVIIPGVLQLPDMALYSQCLSQSGNHEEDGDDIEINKLVTGSLASELYQGINRSTCRNTINGQAQETDIYLQFPAGNVIGELDQAMTGINIIQWTSPKDSRELTREEVMANDIVRYLNELDGVEKISSSAVKKAMNFGLDKASEKMFARASKIIESKQWKKTGRSFERVNDAANIIESFNDGVEGWQAGDDD